MKKEKAEKSGSLLKYFEKPGNSILTREGEHARLHPDIIRRMQAEGHIIGNHTYSHIQLTKNNREKFKEELIKTNEILKEITGEEVQYVRPPYGSWDKSFEKELNVFPVLWTVDPLDWCSKNVNCIT